MTKKELEEKVKQLEKRLESVEKMAHPQGVMFPTYNPPLSPNFLEPRLSEPETVC